MDSKLKQLWKNLWRPFTDPRPSGYPKSFPILPADERVNRPQMFDPALRQYGHGIRLGEPTFRDPEIGDRWFAARRRVMDHLVQLIGASAWKDSLVLRGSYLLKQWFGDAAREPGDLDWVIRPPHTSWLSLSDWGVFNGLADLIRQRDKLYGADITITDMVVDEIWTYDRIPGRRMVLTWQAEDLPVGTSQMDFVLNEDMWTEPVETTITMKDGRSTILWTASPEMSLAWKLVWLNSDSHPQGKDLYDATLLAEYRPLPSDLLRHVIREIRAHYGVWELTTADQNDCDFHWQDFVKDYPGIQGTEQEWLSRLIDALGPAVVGLGQLPPSDDDPSP